MPSWRHQFNTNQITANQPGTTPINVTVAAQVVGRFFSTCPPQSINLTLSSGATTGTITQGVAQNLITSITDTNNQSISGLSIDYQSTNPIDLQVSSTGSVAPAFRACPLCTHLPALGLQSISHQRARLQRYGLSVSSNRSTLRFGNISDYVCSLRPAPRSYFVPIELLNGNHRLHSAPALRAQFHGHG